MKLFETVPPRKFQVGFEVKRDISDCGRVELEPDEQVTFVIPSGGEYDVARKDFGFYATPSMNGRLVKFGFRSAWVRNRDDRDFLLLVEESKLGLFRDYLREERAHVVKWLDGEDSPTDPACPICRGGMVLRFQEEERHVWVCETCAHVLPRQWIHAPATSPPRQDHDIANQVARVMHFLDTRGKSAGVRVLDAGSPTGSFAANAIAVGLDCTALAPDPTAAEHLRRAKGAPSLVGDLLEARIDGRFDLVVISGVLEAARSPQNLLRAARAALAPGGWIHLEVPDGEMSLAEGPHREEFSAGHAFSLQSIVRALDVSGYRVLECVRAGEPRGKFTIRVFGQAVAS